MTRDACPLCRDIDGEGARRRNGEGARRSNRGYTCRQSAPDDAWRALRIVSVQCSLSLRDRFGDIDDAVEAGRLEQANEGRSIAGDRHLATQFPGAPYSADQRAKAGAVDKRHSRKVDYQPLRRRDLRQHLAEVRHGESVELARGAADGETILCLLRSNREHGASLTSSATWIRSYPAGLAR